MNCLDYLSNRLESLKVFTYPILSASFWWTMPIDVTLPKYFQTKEYIILAQVPVTHFTKYMNIEDTRPYDLFQTGQHQIIYST